MTGLMAGYAVALVAMLIAASATLIIIRTVGRLDSTGEELFREEKPKKVAA